MADTKQTNDHRPGGYQKVHDGRNRPISGLWKRNDKYYAQLRVTLADGRRAPRKIPLKANNLKEARVELRELVVKRDQGRFKQSPPALTLQAVINRYLGLLNNKAPATMIKEKRILQGWEKFTGGMLLGEFNKATAIGYTQKLLSRGLSGRTADLHVMALRNVFKHAIDLGDLEDMPLRHWRKLAKPPASRPLFGGEDIDGLCEAARQHLKRSYPYFIDLIRLLQHSGARVGEATRLRWCDVDFERRLLKVGSDGNTKNHLSRTVNFNEHLEAHLKDMAERRQPDSQFLFPSPRRNEADYPMTPPRSALGIARKQAGLQDIGFHDLRHSFISQCVMKGISFMAIARWVGHSDGGVLIGKVYGHLNDPCRSLNGQLQ